MAVVAIGANSYGQSGSGVAVTAGSVTAMAFLMLIVPLLLGWIIYRISRSSLAGNCVMAGLALLLALGQVAEIGQSNASVVQQLKTTMAQIQQQHRAAIQQQINGKHGTIGEAQLLDQRIRAWREASRRSHGEASDMFGVLADTTVPLRDRMHDYENLMRALAKSGSLSPRTLTSVDAIDKRIALFKKFGKANDALDLELQNYSKRLNANLIKAGVSQQARRTIVREVRAKGGTGVSVGIRETDRKFVEIGVNLLQFLKANFDHWHYDPQTGKIMFQGHQLVLQYRQYISQIQATLRKQKQLQKQILNGGP